MASLDVRSAVLTLAVLVLIVAGVYLLDPTMFGLLTVYGEGFEGTLGSDSGASQMVGLTDAAGAKKEKEVAGNPHSEGGDSSSGGLPMAPGAMPSVAGFRDISGTKVSGFRDVSGSGVAGFRGAMDASGNEGFADLEDSVGPAAFGDSDTPAGCYPRDQLTPGELLPKDTNSVWAQQNPMGTGSLKGKNFLSAGALVGVNTVGQSLRNANWQLRSEPANPQVAVSVFNQSTIEPDANRRDLEIA